MPFGAGSIVLMVRSAEGVETPGREEDEWQVCFERGSHNGLLALGNGRRYEHRAATGSCQHLFHGVFNLFFGEASGTLHLLLFRVGEEKAVAYGCIGLTGYVDVEDNAEKVGVGSPQCQASRVVLKVLEPPVQFSSPSRMWSL